MYDLTKINVSAIDTTIDVVLDTRMRVSYYVCTCSYRRGKR